MDSAKRGHLPPQAEAPLGSFAQNKQPRPKGGPGIRCGCWASTGESSSPSPNREFLKSTRPWSTAHFRMVFGGGGAWVPRSVKRLTSAQVTISQFMGSIEPHVGLRAPPFSAHLPSPTHTGSVSLSQKETNSRGACCGSVGSNSRARTHNPSRGRTLNRLSHPGVPILTRNF